jgi:tetratricopeptide (TPR) repeat protein
MQYKNSDKNVSDISAELQVAKILEGSVRRDENNVRIVAQLIDARTDSYLWTETYDEDLNKIFEIQSAVAGKIARSLKKSLSQDEKAKLEKKTTTNLEAYDLYLKGRYHLNKRMPDDLFKAISFFKQSLELDNDYAATFSGLADSYMLLGNYDQLIPKQAFEQARAAATSALKLDPDLAEAHTSLAYVKMHYEHDWQAAESGFKQAMELDPGYPMAYCFYASYLTALKRFDEARSFLKKALELDPLSNAILLEEGLELYFERKFDQTILHCDQLVKRDPLLVLAYIPLAGAYINTNQFNQAQELLSWASVFSQGNPIIVAALGYAYAKSGRLEDAQNMVELLIEKSADEYVSPFWLAVTYVGLNNFDEAMRCLQLAYDERDGAIIYLDVIPVFDPLREDPRFNDLLHKIGFRPGRISANKLSAITSIHIPGCRQ